MKVTVFSKAKMKERLQHGPLKNTAVISFYNEPVNLLTAPIDYTDQATRYRQINLPDLDEHGLSEYGYTVDTFFAEADAVAAFIDEAYRDGLDFACQCQFGFSRSAACAAAILEHYEQRGREILDSADYEPNILVYRKLLTALNALPR